MRLLTWKQDVGPARAATLTRRAVCLLLLLSVHGAHAAAPPHARSTHTQKVRAGSVPGRTADAITYKIGPGTRIVYKLGYTSVGLTDLRPLLKRPQGPEADQQPPDSDVVQSIRTAVTGELAVTVLERQRGGILVSYTLRRPDVRIVVNGRHAAEQGAAVQRELAVDVFARVSPYGRILSVRFPPSASKLTQGFARTLLGATQFVLPAKAALSRTTWTSEEEDPNGVSITRYTRDPGRPSAAPTFRKTVVRYQPRQSATNGPAVVIQPQGSLSALFDVRAGHLISIGGSQAQAVYIAQKPVAHTRTYVSMRLTEKQVLSRSELLALLAAYVRSETTSPAVALSSAPSQTEREATAHRAALGNTTPDEMIEEIKRAGSSATYSAADTALYVKSKALIYLHPDVCPRLGAELARLAPGSKALQILAGALAAVGHAEAQTAIISAIRARPGNWPVLSVLIPALGSVPAPTKPAEDTLWELARNSASPDISTTAELSLGIMAQHLAQIAPTRAASIVDEFVRRLKSAESKDSKSQCLLVLGNTRTSRAVQNIIPWLQDPSPEVRYAGVQALQGIESRQIDTSFVNVLLLDRDTRVRSAAAAALGAREISPPTLHALKKALRTDKADSVRISVLYSLSQAPRSVSEARRVIAWASEKDPSKDVREAAHKLLKLQTTDKPFASPR